MQHLAWIVEPFDTKIRQRLFLQRKALANLPELSDRRLFQKGERDSPLYLRNSSQEAPFKGDKSLFLAWHGRIRMLNAEL